MEESCVGHWTQLNEFHCFEVQHHGVFCPSAVIVTSKNNYFIRGDQSCRLGLYWQGELDWQDAPLIICHVILLNGINSSAAFIATETKNIWIFKYYSWTSTSLLIQISDSLPSVHVYRISFAALENTINWSSTNSIHEITLVSQRMGISILIKRCFFCTVFLFGVVHEDWSWDISKAGV